MRVTLIFPRVVLVSQTRTAGRSLSSGDLAPPPSPGRPFWRCWGGRGEGDPPAQKAGSETGGGVLGECDYSAGVIGTAPPMGRSPGSGPRAGFGAQIGRIKGIKQPARSAHRIRPEGRTQKRPARGRAVPYERREGPNRTRTNTHPYDIEKPVLRVGVCARA